MMQCLTGIIPCRQSQCSWNFGFSKNIPPRGTYHHLLLKTFLVIQEGGVLPLGRPPLLLFFDGCLFCTVSILLYLDSCVNQPVLWFTQYMTGRNIPGTDSILHGNSNYSLQLLIMTLSTPHLANNRAPASMSVYEPLGWESSLGFSQTHCHSSLYPLNTTCFGPIKDRFHVGACWHVANSNCTD